MKAWRGAGAMTKNRKEYTISMLLISILK